MINFDLTAFGSPEHRNNFPLFENVLDREKTDLPKNYLPDAPGIVIAGEGMLRAAGYRPGHYPSRSWYKQNHLVFRSEANSDAERTLQVRACGDFWVVEYFMSDDPHPSCGWK